MQAKTVALDPVAYEILRKAKLDGESFSDAVKNLAGKRRSIMEFAGAWSDVPAGTWESQRARRRREEKARTLHKRKGWG